MQIDLSDFNFLRPVFTIAAMIFATLAAIKGLAFWSPEGSAGTQSLAILSIALCYLGQKQYKN